MFLDTMGSAESEAFETTQPFSPSEQRVAEQPEVGAGGVRPGLSSAMKAELQRLASLPHVGALAVFAASVRHSQPIAVHMHARGKPFLLSIFPREGYYQCARSLGEAHPDDLAQLRLARVEPVLPLLMGDTPAGKQSECRVGPLGLMLWQLALFGPTHELLAEIAGPASYRMTPSHDLAGLPLPWGMPAVLRKLRQRASTVEELAQGTSWGPSQVKRLLNALYLQLGLIVIRSGTGTQRST